jgi:dTDP-4-amino-4,6-dideoxygalactose transaminase
MPVAERITEEVLCLPIYPDLDIDKVHYIAENILKLRR